LRLSNLSVVTAEILAKRLIVVLFSQELRAILKGITPFAWLHEDRHFSAFSYMATK
jgi:hypothetical protein